MMEEFQMSDLGEMAYFLAMEINQMQQGIFICQQKYAVEILKKFDMQNCKPISTPLVQNAKLTKNDGAALIDQNKYRSLIGCLLYLSTTRPDIMFVVSLLSRFMHLPSELHFKVAKRMLRYVKGTTSYGVAFFK